VAIDDTQLKSLIISQVGDLNGVVAANIDTIWEMWAPFAVYPQLQFLYAKREATRTLQGQVWQQVTKTVGTLREQLTDRHAALGDAIADLTAEIAQVRKQAAGAQGVASGSLTTVDPVSPPAGSALDADDPRYSGSPYAPVLSRGIP
jgi:hypothetical protein